MQPIAPNSSTSASITQQFPSDNPSSDALYMNIELPPIPPHSQLNRQQQYPSLPLVQPHQPINSDITLQGNSSSYSGNNRKAKMRKLRACDLCRRKKIRCDYDPSFPEKNCSSCRGYKKSCDFAETAKRRGPPKGYVEGLENRLQRMEQLLLNMASSSNLSPDEIRRYINSNTDQLPSADCDDSTAVSSSSSFSKQHNLPSPGSSSSSSSTPSNLSNPSASPNAHASTKRLHGVDETISSHDSHMEEQLESAKEGKYAYLGSSSGVYMLNRLFPLNSKDGCSAETQEHRTVVRGNEDDVMVARFGHKSAQLTVGPGANENCSTTNSRWRLPPKPVIDRLVELYFTKMNPFLPIVDEEEFMTQYKQVDGNVSKPLLLAICRVTIRMLPKEDPVIQEYRIDRAAMFWDLVQQLDTNYELDFMEPQIESIQILLLSSANADRWSPKSSNWLATSIAVKMAQDLGLHRANTQWTVPQKFVEARKRLWWSAYIVDRWVCASLGRPLTVHDADCDLEYPELGENGKYTAFAAILRLSTILGDVLRAVCSPRARSLRDQVLAAQRISKRLELALSDWKHSLPSSLWLTDEEMNCVHQRQLSTEQEAKLNNGAGQLRILYIAVELLSKRPSIYLGAESSSSSSSAAASPECTVIVPQECLDSATDALDIFQAINFPSLMYLGWSLSSYGLSQTLMFIFLNHKNENPTVVAQAKRQAETFKQHYRKQEDQFIETSLISFLDAISRMIQCDQGAIRDTPSETHNSSTSTSLWGASSGMDWHDVMDLIGQ